jgi:hypothetical protein
MTLLEQTYTQLFKAGIVRSAQAFSTDYLQRNANWYAYQKHTGRDFSVGTAIACMQSLRARSAGMTLTQAQTSELQALQRALHSYLADHHAIADVCQLTAIDNTTD